MAGRTLTRRLTGLHRSVDVVGGSIPLQTEEFALRAYLAAMNPLRNPVKEVMDAYPDVLSTPPLLGLVSDIPWHRVRESEVACWAKAGFSFVLVDGEHSQSEGRYGREQMSLLLRYGLTPIQRLHREARSEHGDALTMGARATMHPYACTVAEAAEYYESISYPAEGAGTPRSRGAFPLRSGSYEPLASPAALREGETETQGWVQFETGELLRDVETRDGVLDVMAAQGQNRAAGFVGALDAFMREGARTEVSAAIDELIVVAAERGLYVGKIVGGGEAQKPEEVEETMVGAIALGCRLLCVHHMASDLPLVGALAATRPFFNAAERCGF